MIAAANVMLGFLGEAGNSGHRPLKVCFFAWLRVFCALAKKEKVGTMEI
jgi:hypothetical protein